MTQILQETAKGIAQDVVTSFKVADVAGRIAPLLFVLPFVLAIVWLAVWRPGWKRLFVRCYRIRVWLLLVAYLGATVTLMIATRLRYHFPAHYHSRFFVQVYWIGWLICGSVGVVLLRWLRLPKAAAVTVVTVVLLAAAGMQWRFHRTRLREFRPSRFETIHGRALVDYLKREVGPDQIVLASRADFLRIYGDLDARHLPNRRTLGGMLMRESLVEAASRGDVWGIVVGEKRKAAEGEFGPWVQQLLDPATTDPDFKRIELDSPAIVLKYVGPVDKTATDR